MRLRRLLPLQRETPDLHVTVVFQLKQVLKQMPIPILCPPEFLGFGPPFTRTIPVAALQAATPITTSA
jgi:hypothetical protein